MARFPLDFSINKGHRQAQGLVFWFGGQHPGSNFCFDSSLYGRHGTLENMDAPTDWVWGHHGMALDFDGANDRVVVPNLGSLFAADVTVSAWVYATNLTAAKIIFDDRAGSGDGFSLFINATSGSIASSWDATTVTQGAIEAGKWQHVTVKRSGSVVKHYLNSVQVGSDGSTSNNASTTTASAIGSRSFSTASVGWLGKLEDVRLYDRALNDSEISDLYSNPTGIILTRRRVWDGVTLGESASASSSESSSLSQSTSESASISQSVSESGSASLSESASISQSVSESGSASSSESEIGSGSESSSESGGPGGGALLGEVTLNATLLGEVTLAA